MRRFVPVLLAAAGFAAFTSALAQDPPAAEKTPLERLVTTEISEERMALGMQLVKLSGNSDTFNILLPNLADQAKNAFIRANPQMQLGIIDIVDRVALSLVNRRPDLDQALARVWASAFTEQEMEELIAFYQSDTGKKFAELYPKILTVNMRTAEEWGKAVGAELQRKVSAELRAAMAAEQKALEGDIAGPALEQPAPAQ